MRCEMRNKRGLKVRQYAAHLIDLTGIFDQFPWATLLQKIGVTELNDIFLNSMPNSWIKQVYVQGFDCEYITLKTVSMFERTDIAEFIYEGLVEPSYK